MRVLTVTYDGRRDATAVKLANDFIASDSVRRIDLLQDAIALLEAQREWELKEQRKNWRKKKTRTGADHT